jgi:uncharacterized protein YpmB
MLLGPFAELHTPLANAWAGILTVLWIYITIVTAAKRLHDWNITAWFSPIVFVPFVPILFLVIGSSKSQNIHGECSENKSGVKSASIFTNIIILLIICAVLIVIASIAIPNIANISKNAEAASARRNIPKQTSNTNAASSESLPAIPDIQVVRGQNNSYSITLPCKWTVKRKTKDFDTVSNYQNLYVGVIAEEVDLGTLDGLAKTVQDNLKENATELTWTDPTPVSIDGRKWLAFTAKCKIENFLFAYQFYVYTGKEGTYQIIGWTTQNLFNRDVALMRGVMESFRFPLITKNTETTDASRNAQDIPKQTPAPNSARTNSTPSTPDMQLVRGLDVSYSIKLPSEWTIKRKAEDFDLISNYKNLYVGVIAEEIRLGTLESLVKSVLDNLKKNTAEITWSDPVPLSIDGRKWLAFTVQCKAKDIPFAYQFYVYTGKEGTYQILGWTTQNLFDRDARLLRSVMQSFRFPK